MEVIFSTPSRTSSMSGGWIDEIDEHDDGDGMSRVFEELVEASRKGLNVVRTDAAAIRHGEMELKR